jgi:nitroimidazol reductase NimA-like FMN-containing flavoprotein (pyridoxamine 5'-phosphate oxidase superfamily)
MLPTSLHGGIRSCTLKGVPIHVKPTIRVLSGEEAEALLLRNRVGRLAYSLHDRVDVEPIHYVYEAPWIFGRTSAGAKLLTLSQNSWCAFETDEVLGMWDWVSVVVKGPFSQRGSRSATWDYDQAVLALRRLLPTAFTAYDPTPQRDIVFGVHASEISGRGSVSNGTFEGQAIAAQSQLSGASTG